MAIFCHYDYIQTNNTKILFKLKKYQTITFRCRLINLKWNQFYFQPSYLTPALATVVSVECESRRRNDRNASPRPGSGASSLAFIARNSSLWDTNRFDETINYSGLISAKQLISGPVMCNHGGGTRAARPVVACLATLWWGQATMPRYAHHVIHRPGHSMVETGHQATLRPPYHS